MMKKETVILILNRWFKKYKNYSLIVGNGFIRATEFNMDEPANMVVNSANRTLFNNVIRVAGLTEGCHIDTDGKYIYIFNHSFVEEAMAKTPAGALIYDTSLEMSFVEEAKKLEKDAPIHSSSKMLDISHKSGRKKILIKEVKNNLRILHDNLLKPGYVLVVFFNDGTRQWVQLSNVSKSVADKYLSGENVVGKLELTPEQSGFAYVTKTEKNGKVLLPNGFAKKFLGDTGLKRATHLPVWMCGNTMIVEGIPYGDIRTTDHHKTIKVCSDCV
jgi:hypothetical protein